MINAYVNVHFFFLHAFHGVNEFGCGHRKGINTSIAHSFVGIPTEIHWPASIGNFISCEDDCFQTAKCPSIVRNFCFKGDKFHGTLTAHNSTIWVRIYAVDPTGITAFSD